MEPITTTAIVATLAALGAKAGETLVSEGVKDAYLWVKNKLGIDALADAIDIAEAAPEALESHPETAREIAEYLGGHDDETVRALGQRLLQKVEPNSPLIGNAYGKNVIAASKIDTLNVS